MAAISDAAALVLRAGGLEAGLAPAIGGSLAFFRLERTGAVDQRAAWPGQFHGAVEQPALQRRQYAKIIFRFEPGHIGMAADGSRRGAGCIEQHGVELLAWLPFQRIGRDSFDIELEAREILLQPGDARRGAIDRGDVTARSRKLGRLAARRGTQVANLFAADVAEQARRDRGGRVLHPPHALGKARQQRDGAMRQRAHGSGRQHSAVEMLGP